LNDAPTCLNTCNCQIRAGPAAPAGQKKGEK
jgi:hypothetical protein